MQTRKITIKDLARQLGYSPSTVSRALRDHYSISEAVKTKVRLHALEVGYAFQPTDAGVPARQTQCSVSVVVTPENLRDELLFRTVICEIEQAFYRRNVSVHFLIARPQAALLPQIKRLRPNGVLVFGMVDREKIAEIAYSGFPAVFFGTMTQRIRANRITVNNYMGGFEAADYLLRQGHTRILFLGDRDFSDDVRLRYEGCRDAVAGKNGCLTSAQDAVAMSMTGAVEIRVQRLQALLTCAPKPTAAVCANDRIAFALYRALAACGKTVPDDLSVVGFDNVAQCERITPALTTIRIPTAEMAQEAVRMLLAQIQDPHKATVFVQMDIQLVERDSVRPLAAPAKEE